MRGACGKMKLYHGTNVASARAILQQGLTPRRVLQSVWGQAPSGHDRVYLTDAYALYFAGNAAMNDSNPRTPGVKRDKRWAILEIDTDRLNQKRFVPDEDFLEQVTRGRTDSGCPTKLTSMVDRTVWFRDHITWYASYWQESLRSLGTCAYRGTIPVAAISRVVLFNPKANPVMALRAMDPTISVLNYRYLGPTYRALVRWVFEPVAAEEIDPLASVHPDPEYPTRWQEVVAQRDALEVIWDAMEVGR